MSRPFTPTFDHPLLERILLSIIQIRRGGSDIDAVPLIIPASAIVGVIVVIRSHQRRVSNMCMYVCVYVSALSR